MKEPFRLLWRFARREDLTGIRLVDVLGLLIALIPVIVVTTWLESGVVLVLLAPPAMLFSSVLTTVLIPSYKDDEDE